MTRRVMSVLVLAVAMTGGLRAQQPDPLADLKAQVEAAALRVEADPQGAAEALDHLAVNSIELRRSRPLTDVEREVHNRLFLLRGRVHLQLLSNDKAQESFRELLRVAPQFTGELAPLEQQMVDELRQKEGGVVEITSVERNARVLIDGMEVGLTSDMPVRVSLIAGTYEVRLEKLRYKPAATRATVVPGETVAIADLVPVRNIPAVVLLSDRDAVEVVVDNQAVGRMERLAVLRRTVSPDESAAIDRAVAEARLDPETTAGLLVRQATVDRPMTLRFHRDCFVDETRLLSLTVDTLDTFAPDAPVVWLGGPTLVRLRPDVGSVRIASTPTDADVFIDGQFQGRTPFERDVCSGPHRIRVRHRIGSYNLLATITRGRTESIDVPLKPDVAFLGAVESTGAPAAELAAQIDRALGARLTSYHLAGRIDASPDVARWGDAETYELIGAAATGDREAVIRLLKAAVANFESSLLIAAIKHQPGPGLEAELFLFWKDHGVVDRLPIEAVTDRGLAEVVARLDAPVDAAELISRTDLGVNVVDTGLMAAPLLVVSVRGGSAAAAAGIAPGDVIDALDGAAVTAAQLARHVAGRKPGDLVALRVKNPAGAARDLSVAVQQIPRRAPAFDTAIAGNALVAKLTAKSFVVSAPADRDLLAFSLAATHMRFGEWRTALTLLTPLLSVPRGEGVGPGVAAYFAARCHEELKERDQAVARYRDAAASDDVIADDGTTVAALARLRLAILGG